MADAIVIALAGIGGAVSLWVLAIHESRRCNEENAAKRLKEGE